MLVQPYTEFRVLNIIPKKYFEEKKRYIDVYEMEEVNKGDLKDSPILYILWVGFNKG